MAVEDVTFLERNKVIKGQTFRSELRRTQHYTISVRKKTKQKKRFHKLQIKYSETMYSSTHVAQFISGFCSMKYQDEVLLNHSSR